MARAEDRKVFIGPIAQVARLSRENGKIDGMHFFIGPIAQVARAHA